MNIQFRAKYMTNNDELEVMYFGPYSQQSLSIDPADMWIVHRRKWITDYLHTVHNAKKILDITHREV